MAVTNSNTIALPPDLMAAAERYAQEVHLSTEVVIEEALRFYFDADPEQNAIRRAHKDRAASLGLTIEEYVEHLVHEVRRENRQSAA